jgi:hypothetical protein
MTKTAYAQRLSAEDLVDETKDMTPEEREERRVENATNPLFDMWLRFTDVFADRAIDRLDITDEDAEAAAKQMEDHLPAGAAFAYLLRQIPHQRRLREISHKAAAIWAAGDAPEMMSLPEIHERYEKLPKGDA